MTRNSTAKLASPWNSAARSDGASVGTLKSERWSIGSAWRNSMTTKAADEHQATDQIAGDRGGERRSGERRDRPQDAEQAEAEGDHAGEVEMVARPATALVQHPCRKKQCRRPDRHVDPEDPSPRHVGDDEPSDHDAEDRTETPANGVVAVGASASFGRVEVGDHRPAVGRDEGAADCPAGSESR